MMGRVMRLAPFTLVGVLAASLSAPARAAPTLERAPGRGPDGRADAQQDDYEDRLVEGDIDQEDVAAFHLDGPGNRDGRARRDDGAGSGSADGRGESWVSVVGFERSLLSGKNDVGAIIVVGLAFDRIAAGSGRRLADPMLPSPAPSPPAHDGGAASQEASLAAAPALARECVAAALQTAGLGNDDERIDALVSRARASALLPETRLRAMRLWDDAAHATTLATTNDTNYYDAIGANLVLELRLTWRLDRWLYAGDEPTLERVRLERQEARTRIATRALETLFAWQRSTVAAEAAAVGSPERLEARLRAAEAEATLDVLTGGWFSNRAASGKP
jgi:hypothetical protein